MRKKIISLVLLALSLTAVFLLLRPRVSVAQSGGDPPALISRVSVTRGSNQTTYVPGSAEERIPLDLNETASVEVQLSPGRGIVVLRAPEGGLIDGRRTLEIDTDQQGRDISFTFDPGDDGGVFYIEVADDRTREAVAEFSVGPDAPLGRPGPALTFN